MQTPQGIAASANDSGDAAFRIIDPLAGTISQDEGEIQRRRGHASDEARSA
ncbi:MAG: hypothetical protein ABIO17_04140 [Pseudoxanthomonas sp.]